MSGVVRAEWTKVRTVAGPAWLLLATTALTVALSTAAVAPQKCCDVDATKLSLTGVQLGQAVVAVLAVLAIGTEYSTGLIRPTLTAMPRRLAVLAAKAVVLCAGVLVSGALGVLGSLLAGRAILSRHGFAPLPLTHGATLRAAGGSVLYLALIALLSLGLATLIRDSAAAIGVVLGLLYLFPILLEVVTDPRWQRHLQQIAPSNAGLAIQNTIALHALPISPWSGLAVLSAWSTAALLAGATHLALRDA